MNETMLRGLTDAEFLRRMRDHSGSWLENMLIERLLEACGDNSAFATIDRLEDKLCGLEEDVSKLSDELEDAESSLADLKAYAGKLHGALAIAEPENDLLDCDDYELLRV